MVSWSAGMRPSTACATTPANRPRPRSSTNEHALVAARQVVAAKVAALAEDGLEAGLDLLAAEALEQRGHAARAHQAGLHLAIEVGGQHVGDARIALDDGEDALVADAFAVELDRRDRDAFL